MTDQEHQTEAAGGLSELTDELCFTSFRPVAWVRQHPDGTLASDELLPDGRIEAVRTSSGAWEPLYRRAALQRVLDNAKSVQAHNVDLVAENERLLSALAAVKHNARIQRTADGGTPADGPLE